MAINNINFTYPVLSNFTDDYVNVDFIAGITGTVEKTKKYSTVKTFVKIDDYALEELLRNNKAKIIIKVYCKETKYRNIFEIKYGHDEIILDNSKLNKNVELTTFVLANEDLKNYYSENFSKDYEDDSFDLEKGSILAIGQIATIFIEKDINDLTQINSVVKICDSKEDNKMMKVMLEDQYIKVFLSSKEYILYSEYAKFHKDLYNSIIVMPSLVYVLDILAITEDDDNIYENSKWYRVLKRKLTGILGHEFQLNDLKTQSSIELVQKLMGYIVSSSFSEIEDIRGERNEN